MRFGWTLILGLAGCATPAIAPIQPPVPVPSQPMAASGALVVPVATPAPGGGSMAYPEGTLISTGNVDVVIGPGGVYTPSHVYLRPGTTTTVINRDRVPHRFDGFNGATARNDAVAPGDRVVKEWHHPGTWTFHDSSMPDAPVLTVTDIPE